METIKTISELLDYVDEILNETNEEIKIGNLTFLPSEVLKEIDPIAYRQAVLDIADCENIEIDELMTISGTGKGGRVTKVEVLNYLSEFAQKNRIIPNVENIVECLLKNSEKDKAIEFLDFIFAFFYIPLHNYF